LVDLVHGQEDYDPDNPGFGDCEMKLECNAHSYFIKDLRISILAYNIEMPVCMEIYIVSRECSNLNKQHNVWLLNS